MIKAVLFDLDGTLLPLNQDEFIAEYFNQLAKTFVARNIDGKTIMKVVYAGTEAMVKNNGAVTNEVAFWNCFRGIMGDEKTDAYRPLFDYFYDNAFNDVKLKCGFNPASRETIDLVKARGFKTALATNPIFPAVATHARVGWAGLSVSDFEFITTYEDSYHCKPNPDYYFEVAKRLGVAPSECVMVGNDATEDLASTKAGMQVFILTDCLLNHDNVDISVYPHGGFDELKAFIGSL